MDFDDLIAGSIRRREVVSLKIESLLLEFGITLGLEPYEVRRIIRDLVRIEPDTDGISMSPDHRENCPDCGSPVGWTHHAGCDTERCTSCGGQRLQCSCPDHDPLRAYWMGDSPGVAACRELGWYAKFRHGQGWVQCEPDDPEATEDLNRWTTFVMVRRYNENG